MTLEASPGSSQHWQPLRLQSGLAPADLYVQVHQRLSVLDAVDKAVAKERSELCVAWNRTLPVSRLPNELLVSIFAQVADAISAGQCDLYLGRCYPNTKWTKLILVCRYWRDVAYASPKLWRAILMGSPAYTRRALALSAPATVDVFFIIRKYNPNNLNLLRPHAHRLRSLHFEVIQKAWKSAAIALFQGDEGTPAVETLELPFAWRTTRDPTEDDFVDLQLTSERFPRLRSLTVALAVAPQDIQVYARLHKLSLSVCHCNFSFDHFLDALAASTNLEILELVSVLQHIQGDWVEDMVAGRNPLSLRHLQSLVLIAHPPVYTSRFLSHVLLSPAVSVRIDGYLGSVVERDVTETVSAMLPSNPAIVLPALVLAKEAVINIYEPEYSLSCSVEPRERGSHLITLLIQSSLIPQWNDFSSHHGARDLLNVLASAPLTKLDFVGDCGDVAAETWTEIFNTYPLLETLYLGITGTMKTAFTGLMDAGPTSDSPVACPRLRSVEISGPFFKKAIDVALRCLRDRAEKGYRLETISMDLWGDRRDDTLLETKYTPQLQELVTDVYCVDQRTCNGILHCMPSKPARRVLAHGRSSSLHLFFWLSSIPVPTWSSPLISVLDDNPVPRYRSFRSVGDTSSTLLPRPRGLLPYS